MKKCIILCLMLVFMLSGNLITVEASSSIGISDEFDDLEGDAQYLGKRYRDNYYLDLEKTGILDAGDALLNGMANILFYFIRFLSFLTVSIFYYAMGFDIAEMFAPYISSIQQTLKAGIFEPLFLLAVCGTFFIVMVKFWKRDMTGVVIEFGKVILVSVLAIMVVKDSATAISYVTGITKSISVSIINGVTYGIDSSGEDYAADAAGILWVNLIHEPWKTLEFGNYIPGDDMIEEFLKLDSGDDERKQLVEDFSPSSAFAKERGAERIGFCIAYLIPCIAKCAIYIVASLIQIVFQLLAILFLFLAPIVLLLALVPGYEMNIITVWARKMLNTQLSVLTVSFVLAVLIKVDKILYDLNPTLGWFPVLLFQTVCGIGLFLYRDEILHMVNRMQKTVQNPGQMKHWLQNPWSPLDMVDGREQRAQHYARYGYADPGGYGGNGYYPGYGGYGSNPGYGAYGGYGDEQESDSNNDNRPTTDMNQNKESGSENVEKTVARPYTSNVSMSSQEIYDIFNKPNTEESASDSSYRTRDISMSSQELYDIYSRPAADQEVTRPVSHAADDSSHGTKDISMSSQELYDIYSRPAADQEVTRPVSYAADPEARAERPISYAADAADPEEPGIERPVSYAADAADPEEPGIERPVSYAADAADPEESGIERPVSYGADAADPEEPGIERPASYAADAADPEEPGIERPVSYAADAADQEARAERPVSYAADAADQEARAERPVSYAADAADQEAGAERPASYAADAADPGAGAERPASYAADAADPGAGTERPAKVS